MVKRTNSVFQLGGALALYVLSSTFGMAEYIRVIRVTTLVGSVVCRYAPFLIHPPWVWASLVFLLVVAVINFG